MTQRPVVLVICDGWGERPESTGNAIALAPTPHLDALRARWPHTVVKASGEAVGLPEGQQGNSEVGHLTIGAGRIVRQPLTRQHHEISTGTFYSNEVLVAAIELALERGTALHILGLVSPGGVHSHQDGAVALASLAASLGLTKVFIHAFTDGRDTPPSSAREHLATFEADLQAAGSSGRVASLSGRYYAMDRDQRWDRTQQVYDLLTAPKHPTHPSATGYIADRYREGETDEFLRPIAIASHPDARVRLEDGDVVVFTNFRPDRSRQLSHALIDPDFTGFKRGRVVHNLYLVTFADYDSTLQVPVAFPKTDLRANLAEVTSSHGLRQFHIAETEKYAHVTYFLNGGREQPYAGEYRQLIPSPKVTTYDLTPAMSAEPLTEALIRRLQTGQDDLLIMNFANADMVGHTGNLKATEQAITTVDTCIGQIATAVIAGHGALVITADHGNAEYEIDEHTGQPSTSHTTYPVPLIVCGTPIKSLRAGGGLEDVAPTVLDLLGLTVPPEMTGTSLLKT